MRFVITSAGLVGSDGPVQCGAFDITFMSCLPNMIVMAPANEDEIVHMVATAANINDRPVCFRYPRGAIVRASYPISSGTLIEVTSSFITSLVAAYFTFENLKLNYLPKDYVLVANGCCKKLLCSCSG